MGRVMRIYVWFNVHCNEPEVFVCQALPQPLSSRQPCLGPLSQEFKGLLRIVFRISYFINVPDTYYYCRLYAVSGHQQRDSLISAPLLPVPGCGTVKQHLTVMHVDYSILFRRVIVVRKPDVNVSRFTCY